MINTVLQAIERFEASPTFEQSHLPTSIYEDHEADDTIVPLDTEEDTSDDSDEYKDAQESSGSEEIKFNTHPTYIKQTLKDKIRIRRESEGADEITNLFEPPKFYKLTPEEELKNEIRKQRNRRSATKSRLKRIAKEKQLEKDAVELEAENERRTKEVNILKKMKLIFSQILQRHLPSCPKAKRQIQSKTVNAPAKIPTTPTVCASNGITGDNSILSRLQSLSQTPQGETPISVREHQPAQHQQKSTQISWPTKRKATDEVYGQRFKVPKVLNQTETANQNTRLVNTVTQTFEDNTFSEVWQGNTCMSTSQIQTSNSSVQSVSMATEMGIHSKTGSESVLCELPNTGGILQQALLETSSIQGMSKYDTTACLIGEKTRVIGEAVDTNWNIHVTEEQKINQIKQHLLDDFPMASHR